MRFKTRGSKAGSEAKASGRVLTGASATSEEQWERVRVEERTRFPKSGIAETVRKDLPTEGKGE